MKSRTVRIVLVIILMLILGVSLGLYNKWNIVAWYLGIPAPQYAVKVLHDVKVPMRDGVKLSADIYMPSAEGKYPVILLRTMYGKSNADHKYAFTGSVFASQGFIFVVQDVRGKFDS